MRTIILWFGTEKAFERFKYDSLRWVGFEFKLCTRFDQIQGTNFHGYFMHYSTPQSLQKQILQNYDLLQHLIEKHIIES